MENLAEILIGKLAKRPSLNSEHATITCLEAARAVRIARLEAKIEAYKTALYTSKKFTNIFLSECEKELTMLKQENQL